jgi:hypothetical protein
MWHQLAQLGRDTWVRAVPYALLAAVLIAVPSDLIDTPLFGRPVETRAIDYVILAVTAGLIGLIFAIRAEPPRGEEASGTDLDEAMARDQNRTIWGGLFSFLAVGCPVCNQAVVALVGASGAMAWWAPVQPIVGLLAVGLLVYTLRRRLQTYQLTSCPIPVRGDSLQPTATRDTDMNEHR